jgi:hypothetical protein
MKKTIILLFVFLTLNLSPAIVYAEIVGKAIVDGKVVLLDGDKTWKYETSELDGDECTALSQRVSFCPPNERPFKKLPRQGVDQLGMFIRDGLNYGAVVEEEVGSDEGISEQFMLTAIEANMEMAGVSETVVADHEKCLLDKMEATCVAYLVEMQNIDFIFMYTVVIADNNTFQFITWSIAKQLEPIHRDTHADFVDQFEINWEG